MPLILRCPGRRLLEGGDPVNPDAPLPVGVSELISKTLVTKRDSPQLSVDEIKGAMHRLGDFAVQGCDEDDVAAILNDAIFPTPLIDPLYGSHTGLKSSSNTRMSQYLVPTNPVPHKVTQPKADKLYGHLGNSGVAFTNPQLLAQTTIHPQDLFSTSQGLLFPFLAIEFEAAGGMGGDLWLPQISVRVLHQPASML
jgi:hypothetical protein